MLARSEATIANILEAARDLFLARNYAEVTMDKIAEQSQVTKGGLYHHFASKEELYLVLMHADLEEKKVLFSDAIDSGETCRTRLRSLTEIFFNLPRNKKELIRLVRRDINVFHGDVRAQLIQAYQASLPELVEGVIRDGMRDGEIAPVDARLLSWQFVALVEVTLTEYADEVFQNKDEKLDYVLNLFFRGTAADGIDKKGTNQ